MKKYLLILLILAFLFLLNICMGAPEEPTPTPTATPTPFGPLYYRGYGYDQTYDGDSINPKTEFNMTFTDIQVVFNDGNITNTWHIDCQPDPLYDWESNNLAYDFLGAYCNYSENQSFGEIHTVTIPAMSQIGCGCPPYSPGYLGWKYWEYKRVKALRKTSTLAIRWKWYYTLDGNKKKSVGSMAFVQNYAHKVEWAEFIGYVCSIRHFTVCLPDDEFQNPFTFNKCTWYIGPCDDGRYETDFGKVLKIDPDEDARVCVITHSP